MAASDQQYRNQKMLDVVFGVSCGLLLFSTIWMFVQDYNRDFKSIQRTFRDVETALAEREMVDKLPNAEIFGEKRLALRDARRRLEYAGAERILGADFEPTYTAYLNRTDPEAQQEAAAKLKNAQEKFNQKDRRLKAEHEQADEKYRGIKADLDANNSYLIIATDEAGKYPPGSSAAKSHEAEARRYREKIARLESELAAAKDKLDEIDTRIKEDVRAPREVHEKKVAAAEDDLKRVSGAFERYGKLAVQKNWGFGDTFRALPILDGFESPTKVKQIWLPDLTIDYSFKEVPRYDRCTTCHLGIDRPALSHEALVRLGDADENARLTGKLVQAQQILEKRSEKDLGFDPADLPGERRGHVGLLALLLALSSIVAALSLGLLARSTRLGMQTLLAGLVFTVICSGAMAYFAPREPAVKTVKLDEGQVSQYAGHPRLDLFVDNNSPHGMEKFGCTICHGGQGSATEFTLASHTPNDVVQEHHWKDSHGWAHSHFWDYPMFSKRFVESSCVKCHHQMTDLIRHGAKEEAPKLLRGYNLVKDNGCFGCHEIPALKAGREVGPDLRLEPAPALEYLSAIEQDRIRSDAANPPGGLRKVGPSLRRLAEKTNEDWVRKWVNDPRGFRPDTKMPHFYNLSTNRIEKLPDEQKTFPATEIHAIAHYLFTESKDHLDGKDFYREKLLGGRNNITLLQTELAKNGLTDKDTKDLFDVSRRFVDLALLSNPLASATINAHAHRQRQLQERLSELQKRVSDLKNRGAEADVKAAQSEITGTAKELEGVTAALVQSGRPVPISQRILGEDGSVVALPEKTGDATNGRRLFTEKGCLACHAHEGTTKADKTDKTISPVIGAANFGPELSRIAAKLSPAIGADSARRWLVQWLLNPNVYHPRTKMPITHLKPADANDIATWLLAQKVTDWQPADPAAPDIKSLKALARVYLGKAPGVTRTELDEYLPADGNEMPGIPSERLGDLARDAEERQLEKGKVTPDLLKWYVGKKAIGRQGCYACHDIPGFETAKPIGTALNDWGKKDAERLAFEDADSFARKHYNIVPRRVTRLEAEKRITALEAKGDSGLTKRESTELKKLKKQADSQERIFALEDKLDSKVSLSSQEQHELDELRPLKFFEKHGTHEPVEGVFFEALEHHTREGFLHMKLLEPRSYDYNRDRAWDDRLRMPQFKFARSRQKVGESPEQYEARQEKEEAEAREAVMTFILGLVADPIPFQYVNQPKAEKKAEVLGRQVLDKFKCAGCHQVRPGVYEFKSNDEALRLVMQAYQLTAGDNDANFREDFVFPGHNAWTGSPPTSDRMIAYGYFDPDVTKQAAEIAPNSDAVRLTDALRFTPADKVARDLPAGSNLLLPRGKYMATAPFGGTFTDLMVPYMMRKNPTLFPKDDPGKSRAVLPPPLVREGERVQPDWLYKFLLNPIPVRPETYLVLRMPKFNMSPEEARALVNYFAAVSRSTNPGAGVTYPYVSIEQRDEEYWKRQTAEYAARLKAKGVEERAREMKTIWEARAKKEQADLEAALPGLKKAEADATAKKTPDLADRSKAVKDADARIAELKQQLAKGTFPDQEQRWKSQDIYARDAFKLLGNPELCLKCHSIGNIRAEGPQGPNLALSAERIRPDWAEQWIAHPKRMFTYQPVMPQNFPNEPDPLKWKFQDSFLGSPLQQIKGVRDVLMDQARLSDLLANPPAPPPAAGGGKK